MTELARAIDRSRVSVGGTIVAARVWSNQNGRRATLGFRCTLDDGTGEIDLMFLGRFLVPGFLVGARCHVDGTARMDHGRLTLWNPLYRLERPETGEGDGAHRG